MGKVKDLTGRKFGKLVALEWRGMREHKSVWRCRCECGKVVDVLGASLLSGNTKSCGCAKRDAARARGQGKRRGAETFVCARCGAQFANPDPERIMRRKYCPDCAQNVLACRSTRRAERERLERERRKHDRFRAQQEALAGMRAGEPAGLSALAAAAATLGVSYGRLQAMRHAGVLPERWPEREPGVDWRACPDWA